MVEVESGVWALQTQDPNQALETNADLKRDKGQFLEHGVSVLVSVARLSDSPSNADRIANLRQRF